MSEPRALQQAHWKSQHRMLLRAQYYQSLNLDSNIKNIGGVHRVLAYIPGCHANVYEYFIKRDCDTLLLKHVGTPIVLELLYHQGLCSHIRYACHCTCKANVLCDCNVKQSQVCSSRVDWCGYALYITWNIPLPARSPFCQFAYLPRKLLWLLTVALWFWMLCRCCTAKRAVSRFITSALIPLNVHRRKIKKIGVVDGVASATFVDIKANLQRYSHITLKFFLPCMHEFMLDSLFLIHWMYLSQKHPNNWYRILPVMSHFNSLC